MNVRDLRPDDWPEVRAIYEDVQESATNAGGTGGPATSTQTPVVKAPPAQCVVPKVKGKPLRKAKAAIKSHPCRVGKIHRVFSNHVKKGRVISQKPRPHKTLPHGAKVNLVVSRGRHR